MITEKTCLLAEPSYGRFLYYKLVTLVPFCAAIIAIAKHSGSIYWLLLYIGICLIHVGIVYSNKCPRCAYYKIGEKTHKCYILWGFPKIFKAKPGPDKPFLGKYIPIAILIITFFPVYWLLFQWELLVLYFLSWGVLVSSILLNECPRCISFHCKNNRVPEDVQKAFLDSQASQQ
jgi:hypothetical protein